VLTTRDEEIDRLIELEKATSPAALDGSAPPVASANPWVRARSVGQ
jgi:hypothetical protein